MGWVVEGPASGIDEVGIGKGGDVGNRGYMRGQGSRVEATKTQTQRLGLKLRRETSVA